MEEQGSISFFAAPAPWYCGFQSEANGRGGEAEFFQG